MIPTRPTRDKAIDYITNQRTETVIYDGHACQYRYTPVAVHQVGESHWWTVDDIYGARHDNWIRRELVLWHICYDDGEWVIIRWSGSEVTRTDCPVELADMVRGKVKHVG